MKNTRLSQTQIKDSGLALVLIFFIAAYFGNQSALFIASGVLLIISMTIPLVFKPFAIIWFGLAVILGKISSTLILTLLFLFIVIPIGYIRRSFKSDPLQLNLWNNGSESVFKINDYQYSGIDMENPY